MLPCMSAPKKRKPGRPRKGEAVTGPEQRPTTTPFRPEDNRLFDALDAYAKRIRRSRNMAINLLLEEAMEREGLWPPPETKGGK
jgi:hypothetical protein